MPDLVNEVGATVVAAAPVAAAALARDFFATFFAAEDFADVAAFLVLLDFMTMNFTPSQRRV